MVGCKAVIVFCGFSASFNASRRIMEWNLPAADSQRSTEIFLRAWLKNWYWYFRRRIEKDFGRFSVKLGGWIGYKNVRHRRFLRWIAGFFPPGGSFKRISAHFFLDNWCDQCRFFVRSRNFFLGFLVLAVSTWKYEMTDSLYCSMAGRNIIRENKLSLRVSSSSVVYQHFLHFGLILQNLKKRGTQKSKSNKKSPF